MLKKLLKYDLKGIFKFLLIFYALGLVFAAIAKAFLSFENSLVLTIFGEIFRGAAISMMFSIVINNLMRVWVRFKQGMYGDESYLTHTLPVEKKTLYMSKFFTSIITMLVSVAVVAVILIICYGIDTIKNLFNTLSLSFGDEFTFLAIGLALVLFLELLNGLQCGLTGIIAGHRANDKKIGFSVLFGFITYMISQGVTLALIAIASLFNKSFKDLLFSADLSVISIDLVKDIIYLSAIVYTAIIIVNYFVNIKLLKKGVNVD